MHIYFLDTTNIRATLPTFSSPHNKDFRKKHFSLHSMSSTSYHYLLLFFLCFLLHACYARHLIPLNKKLVEEKSHFSMIKNDEKNGLDSSPKLNEDYNKTETRLVSDSEKPRNRRISTNHKVHKGTEHASGSLKKSLVSVSWRVPHNKKPRQKHPGFDLDYSPPKTHPPHHN